MTETTDGFDIAERDLTLRGLVTLRTRQAGIPTFRLIDLARDHDLLDVARREAADWLTGAHPSRQAIAALIDSWSARFRLIEVG